MSVANTTSQPPKWYRDWLAYLLIGSMVYGLFCVFGLANDAGRPFPGFLTVSNIATAQIEIEWNSPSWWWSSTTDRPAVNDHLMAIDGVSFQNLTDTLDDSQIYANAYVEHRSTIPALIHRDGENIELTIPVHLFSWTHFWDIMTAPILVSFCLWMLAFILYRAAPTQQIQRITITAFLVVVVVVIASRPMLFQSDQWHIPLLTRRNTIQAIVFPFTGALFLHLAIDFPYRIFEKKWQFVRTVYLFVIYAIATISSLLFIISRLIIDREGITPTVRVLDALWINSASYLIAAATIILVIRLSLDAFFFARQPRYKREALTILISILIALPAVWLTIHRGFGDASSILLMQSLVDPRYFFLAIPFAFAAITLRYHTFDGAENWMIFVLLAAISGLASNICMIILFLQSPQAIQTLHVPVQLVLFFIFFAVSFFWSRQNDWNGWLGRIFQWERVNYSAVRQFGEALADTSYQNAEQLGSQIAAILCEELDLECAAVWMGDGAVYGGLKLTAVSGTWTSSLPKTLTPSTKTFRPQRLQANSPDWLAVLPDNAAVVLPLKSANQLLGAMVVGKRWDSAVFDERDLTVLSLIAQQATALLHNAQQLEALRAADKQMLQIQTDTQQKIARDLHDYILPALGRFPMQIESSLRYLGEDQEKSRQILQESVEQLGETAVQLRRIQQDLIIRPMEYGLSPYLLDLTQQFTADTGIPITLILPPETDKTISDTATREVVYAVWQQALDNVAVHAHATRITIKLTIMDEIHFSIEDDGIGTTEEQRAQAAANGRFGLKSMQTRLEGVNGRFRFQSQPEQGSTVEGWLPFPLSP